MKMNGNESNNHRPNSDSAAEPDTGDAELFARLRQFADHVESRVPSASYNSSSTSRPTASSSAPQAGGHATVTELRPPAQTRKAASDRRLAPMLVAAAVLAVVLLGSGLLGADQQVQTAIPVAAQPLPAAADNGSGNSPSDTSANNMAVSQTKRTVSITLVQPNTPPTPNGALWDTQKLVVTTDDETTEIPLDNGFTTYLVNVTNNPTFNVAVTPPLEKIGCHMEFSPKNPYHAEVTQITLMATDGCADTSTTAPPPSMRKVSVFINAAGPNAEAANLWGGQTLRIFPEAGPTIPPIELQAGITNYSFEVAADTPYTLETELPISDGECWPKLTAPEIHGSDTRLVVQATMTCTQNPSMRTVSITLVQPNTPPTPNGALWDTQKLVVTTDDETTEIPLDNGFTTYLVNVTNNPTFNVAVTPPLEKIGCHMEFSPKNPYHAEVTQITLMATDGCAD